MVSAVRSEVTMSSFATDDQKDGKNASSRLQYAKEGVVVGIPAYNEEEAIAKVIVLAQKYSEKVIVADDGSSDMTGQIARALGAEVIAHTTNKGKGEALRNLFLKAQSENPEVFVTIDADGQHDANEIPLLVVGVRDGADVVVGSRQAKDIPMTRRVGGSVLNYASRTGVRDAQSGFRAYNGSRLGSLVPSEMGMGADAEILNKATELGMKIVELPISVSYEDNTPTNNALFHGSDVLFTTIKRLSIRHPLMFYGIPGFLFSLAAIGLWWWALTNFATTKTLLTNVAIVAAASTIVGLILMSTAVLLWVLVSIVRENHT